MNKFQNYLTEKEKEDMLALYAKGAKINAIAKQFGRATSSVNYLVHAGKEGYKGHTLPDNLETLPDTVLFRHTKDYSF
jgi:transposase-like protein